MVHRLSRTEARRVAVLAQLLTLPSPRGALDVVRHLGFLQVDLTTVVAPHADLVLWSRMGSDHEEGGVDELIGDGALLEHQAMLRPAEDIALLQADMDAWPGVPPLRRWQVEIAGWVAANDGCRQEILATLRAEGPLPAGLFPTPVRCPGARRGGRTTRAS